MMESFLHFVQVFGTITALYVALLAYRNSNSIKRAELIQRLYNAFMKKGAYEFYDKIRNRDAIEWGEWGNVEGVDEETLKANEKLLNKSLTLFDELNYLQTQGL